MTKWAIDLDGVITANPPALSWLTYHLLKNENQNQIFIITWRDGSDALRINETIEDLKYFGMRYTGLIMAPRKFKTMRIAAFWKIAKIKNMGINIWLDDELKNYKRDLNINLDKLLPEVIKIYI